MTDDIWEKKAREIIKNIPGDGNGNIEFEEFERMLAAALREAAGGKEKFIRCERADDILVFENLANINSVKTNCGHNHQMLFGAGFFKISEERYEETLKKLKVSEAVIEAAKACLINWDEEEDHYLRDALAAYDQAVK